MDNNSFIFKSFAKINNGKINNPLKPFLVWALKNLERILTQSSELKYGPVFIVGSPRSGTTVVRQVVSSSIASSYFTNTTNNLFRKFSLPLPVLSAILTNTIFRTTIQITEKKSNYGITPGRGAPCEGEFIWSHWFQTRHGAVEVHELPAKQQREIYLAVANTERIYGKPFINKTTVLSLRIGALAEIFPKAVFIRINRDLIDIAQSLLIARKTKYEDWLGAKPKECEQIPEDDLVKQVCTQVRFTEKKISEAEVVVGKERFWNISYKGFCDNPVSEMQGLSRFLDSFGIPAELEMDAIPTKLPFSYGQRREITHAEHTAICQYFSVGHSAE